MLLGTEDMFADSFAVFRKMQRPDLLASVSDTFDISELLAKDQWWTDLGDERHQDIGRFIAHHWSELSEFYQGRIYSVYDYTTDDGEGMYMKVKAYHVSGRFQREAY